MEIKHKDKNLRSEWQCLKNSEVFLYFHDQVFKWGVDRNITAEGGATAYSQIKKLKEEVQEIEDALIAGDSDEVADGIGDALVVLIQICRLGGYSIDECLKGAYEEIRNRKGRMENGVFVKEV